jgi:hypothetical protein
MSIWRRSAPFVQKKVPAVEENSPSCQPASDPFEHGRDKGALQIVPGRIA